MIRRLIDPKNPNVRWMMVFWSLLLALVNPMINAVPESILYQTNSAYAEQELLVILSAICCVWYFVNVLIWICALKILVWSLRYFAGENVQPPPPANV